jgi:hypothetical protein
MLGMKQLESRRRLTDFLAEVAKSAAYHEAGHVTAAVVQGLPLQTGGIHVDLGGCGISYYCHRVPGDLKTSSEDHIEREKTIIALYSAWVSQKTFLPTFEECNFWNSDKATVDELLREMQSTAPEKAGEALWAGAKRLVEENWKIIEELAKALLAKPVTPMPESEFQKGWSSGCTKREKCMSCTEVVEFFKRFRIECVVANERRG